MACRRCSECKGDVHHWLESVYGDEPIDEFSPSHICKHCDAVGDQCETCEGDGDVPVIGLDDDGGFVDREARCPSCKGYSVVERPTTAEAAKGPTDA